MKDRYNFRRIIKNISFIMERISSNGIKILFLNIIDIYSIYAININKRDV